jgi:GTP-binding protein EngB required for normal cell division
VVKFKQIHFREKYNLLYVDTNLQFILSIGDVKMENIRKMNVLVLGNSGAGKSTLIKAISGAEVKTAVGGSVTQKIDVYESTTWPIRCIDTKGFEYKWFEQQKTIWQIKRICK